VCFCACSGSSPGIAEHGQPCRRLCHEPSHSLSVFRRRVQSVYRGQKTNLWPECCSSTRKQYTTSINVAGAQGQSSSTSNTSTYSNFLKLNRCVPQILLMVAAVVSLSLCLFRDFGQPRPDGEPPVDWVEGVTILVAIVIFVLVGSLNDWQKEK